MSRIGTGIVIATSARIREHDVYELLRARKNGKTAFVGLLFNEKEFVLDKEDLLAIDNILKTVSEGMGDPEVVGCPLLYREIVMNRVGK